jgi:zinc protease
MLKTVQHSRTLTDYDSLKSGYFNLLRVTQTKQIPRIGFTEYDLDNGLHVILHKDDKVPAVCINICYHVGSKNETPERAGFAHLFEHLLFEGSKHVPKGKFDEYITGAGGNNNAYTTEDKTNYYMTLPSHELELGLWLESDRMLECVVTEESLRNQKDVVMEEKRERYDNSPYGSLSERMMRLAYQNYPYKWTVIGDMKSIEAATLSDVQDFFNTFYVPANATLSVTGNINEDEAKTLIEKYFGSIPARSAKSIAPEFSEGEQAEERKLTVTDEPVPLPAVFWTYLMPPDGSKEAFALDLLTDVLSTGQSSRLYKQLVYEKQLASDISAYIDVREKPGLVWLYGVATTPDADIAPLEEAMEAVLADIRKNGVTAEELEKAKNRAEMRAVTGRLRISTKADILAHSHIFYGDTQKVNTLIDMQQNITVEDVNEAARTLLIPTKRNSVVFLPPKA